MKIVSFVPIKLNSQRLKNKNILPINGKPLCYHIFDTLLQVEEINETYCYCSDEKIKNLIPNNVLFLKRKDDLNKNEIKGLEIYLSFAEQIEADIYVLCHATSPFLTSRTIKQGIKELLENGKDSAFTVQRHQTFAWYKNKPLNYKLEDVVRTQDLEPIFTETSGMFVFKKEILLEHKRRIGFNPAMVETGSVESIDIDTKQDYEDALKLANRP